MKIRSLYVNLIISFMVHTKSMKAVEDNPVSASALFEKVPPSPHLKISVILPVKDEADHLWKTLEALRNQYDVDGIPLAYNQYEVLLLANNCSDDSAGLARAYQKTYPEFRLLVEEIRLAPPVAHIGTVRRLLMDAAYNRFIFLKRPKGIIASTDGDSEVDKNWISNTIREIKKGNDVVGGRILTRPENSLARIYYLRDVTYKHLVSRVEALIDPVPNDPWPRHYQCFGASFAVTCSIYDRSGRLPVVPFLEDMAFHRALTRIDARIRLSPLVKVMTSTRIQGRVDFGFSIQLKQWGEMNEAQHPVLVEQADALFRKLKARNLLRHYWNLGRKQKTGAENQLAIVADMLLIDKTWLGLQASAIPYFGMLWEAAEQEMERGAWLGKVAENGCRGCDQPAKTKDTYLSKYFINSGFERIMLLSFQKGPYGTGPLFCFQAELTGMRYRFRPLPEIPDVPHHRLAEIHLQQVSNEPKVNVHKAKVHRSFSVWRSPDLPYSENIRLPITGSDQIF